MSKETWYDQLMVVHCSLIDEVIGVMKDAQEKLQDNVFLSSELQEVITKMEASDWLSNIIKIDFSMLSDDE